MKPLKFDTDPFEEHIKEKPNYNALGKSFDNIFAARRHVAEDKLRLAVRDTHTRLPLVLVEPTSNPPAREMELRQFDMAGDMLRTWLVANVHVLLPALQLVAQANPYSPPQPVGDDE